ncbi:MAG: pyridoxamine 5'-phosphate oxidase family protein [Cyclobacteriaceae bacterium]
MKFDVADYINRSVLCWLATADRRGQPNVSPKEVFAQYGEQYIIVANIASPGTVKNIRENSSVCISFIDVFLQKGVQIKGEAQIINTKMEGFDSMKEVLLKITRGKFPFETITKIKINQIKPIIAPSYLLYPETTTEAQQVASAKLNYDRHSSGTVSKG